MFVSVGSTKIIIKGSGASSATVKYVVATVTSCYLVLARLERDYDLAYIDRMAEHLYTNDKLVAEVVNNVAVLVTDTMVVDPICSVDIGARTAAFTGTPAAFNVGVLEALMSAITNIEGAGAITNILE